MLYESRFFVTYAHRQVVAIHNSSRLSSPHYWAAKKIMCGWKIYPRLAESWSVDARPAPRAHVYRVHVRAAKVSRAKVFTHQFVRLWIIVLHYFICVECFSVNRCSESESADVCKYVFMVTIIEMSVIELTFIMSFIFLVSLRVTCVLFKLFSKRKMSRVRINHEFYLFYLNN